MASSDPHAALGIDPVQGFHYVVAWSVVTAALLVVADHQPKLAMFIAFGLAVTVMTHIMRNPSPPKRG